MANLAISAVCNQKCPYCFTVDHRNERGSDRDFLGLDDLDIRLNFLKRSDIGEARLIGGEPTLHPQFVELVECARKSGFEIVVFSNGLMPESALTCLASLPVAECTVLVNVNDPAVAGKDIHAWRCATIERLGARALLGFNIYRPDFQLDFLLPMIAGTGCRPAIRLSMAQPCLSGNNRYIHPRQYVAVGTKIVSFARVAARSGVGLRFDCGFVRCMFSEQDLEALRSSSDDVGWRCNPILDVDIEGHVLHCYPLSGIGSLPLTPDTDAPALRSTFISRTHPHRQAGVFQECSSCPFKASGECPGGCLAVTLRRFRHTPFRVAVPSPEVGA